MRERINMCKLCCGNIKLPTVTGRSEKSIKAHERICMLCTMETMGDEFQFFECDEFKTLRHFYIKPYFRKYPNTYRIEQLFHT